MMGIGTQEVLLLLVVGVLLFGSKLPDVAKSIGRSFHEFKKGLNDMGGNEIREVFNFDPSAPVPEKKKDDSTKTEAQKFEPPPDEDPVEEQADAAVADVAETTATETPEAVEASFQHEKYS